MYTIQFGFSTLDVREIVVRKSHIKNIDISAAFELVEAPESKEPLYLISIIILNKRGEIIPRVI